jgi:two-component system chemotaxis response regulator CheB
MPKIRVLVVDDAVVMRKLISEALSRDPELEVVGVAANGRIALQKVTQVNPDIITLDVEMPEMDGLETLRELRKTHPKMPVLMFSTVTTRGAAATLDALSLGASDYVTKPANVGSVTECIERLQGELVAKIKLHCRHLCPQPLFTPARGASPTPPVAFRSASPSVASVVCIATSTGGPNALAEVFAHFPASFPLPLLIVQHMPPLFTAMLAERLNKLGSVRFHEGAENQLVECGHAYLAPGGKHMEVRRVGTRVVLHVQEDPPENSCRPAADVLFRSAVAVYGGNILGVVMTGMGQDGMRGCELICHSGGRVVVQDEASSVVWGMPGSVAQAGYADKIVPLDQIAGEITRRVRACPAPVFAA